MNSLEKHSKWAGRSTTVIAKHDDGGTLVSIYVGEELSDRYYVNAEAGDWRKIVGKVDHVREYHA